MPSANHLGEMSEKVSLARVGNYELTGRKLGSGSFAKVYEARHRQHNTLVALKTINVTTMKDAYMRKHFKREAALLSRLSHPAIVALFEVIKTRNHYCIAMEFGGLNLVEFVQSQKRGRVEEVTARSISRQLASAVAHMHDRGVIHRDLKLENITINPLTKNVKLCDFGLSNLLDPTAQLKTHCGSPEYAAPELHLGESYGSEVDIWALGVVLFAMVVGRLPFEVESKRPVSNQHRRELLLDETKRGVKTMKHQVFMGSASFLFKDLMSKMLNPKRQLRQKIAQVAKHPWILGVFVEEFAPIADDWRDKIFETYAKRMRISIESVSHEIAAKPYGELGGIYNIELHRHRLNKIALKPDPSCCRIRKISTQHTMAINRPTTAIENNFISTDNSRQRPSTAHGSKTAALKPFGR